MRMVGPAERGFIGDTLIYLQVPTTSNKGLTPKDSLIRARQAFNLACVEQLVPLLTADTIEHVVFPLCLPYAYLPSSSVLYSDLSALIKAFK
jgi:hypothetical protein